MIINFFNPITETKDSLKVDYPKLNDFQWRTVIRELSNNTIEYIIKDLLIRVDCTKEYPSGRPMMTHFTMYKNYLDEIYMYLCKIDDYHLYNRMIDLIIKTHIDNLIFEHENPYVNKKVATKSKRVSKKNIPNIFTRQETKDLFTNEVIYIYENLHTKEVIKSKNPNLLEELNAPKKKVRTKKEKGGVPMNLMTFSFKPKIKDNDNN